MKHDVFICHASEDKEDFVRPLAELLKKHQIDVWYDEFALEVGDSLSQKIDSGLASSRFGIVVLSHNFFKKPWAKRELAGLTAKEMFNNHSVILPIWHRVGTKDVIEFSPPLADKKAILTKNGINSVLNELIRKIRPEPSPLEVAKKYLSDLGNTPPAISDEWWLDVIEYKEFLKFPDINANIWWIFPLPFPAEKRGYERGMNIASTALQRDWSFEAEELKISAITPPEEVHAFLKRWPGLIEHAKRNPEILALYAPQLTISGFDYGFEAEFDNLLDDKGEEGLLAGYGSPSTKDGAPPLCRHVIALRHPTFGNYTDDEIAYRYFNGYTNSYIRNGCDSFCGLLWLLSKESSWLPERYKELLINGLKIGNWWLRDATINYKLYNNPFFNSLINSNRENFRMNQMLESALNEAVEKAKKTLLLNEDTLALTKKLLNLGIIESHYNHEELIQRMRKKT